MRRWQTPGAGDETLVPESTSSAAAMRDCPIALAQHRSNERSIFITCVVRSKTESDFNSFGDSIRRYLARYQWAARGTYSYAPGPWPRNNGYPTCFPSWLSSSRPSKALDKLAAGHRERDPTAGVFRPVKRISRARRREPIYRRRNQIIWCSPSTRHGVRGSCRHRTSTHSLSLVTFVEDEHLAVVRPPSWSPSKYSTPPRRPARPRL